MLVDFSIQERICSISTWAHLRGSEASFLWKPAQSRWQEAGIQLGDHSGQGQAQSAFKGPWHLSPSQSTSPKPPWWQVYVKHFDIFLPSASSSLITMININNITTTSTNNTSLNLSPQNHQHISTLKTPPWRSGLSSEWCNNNHLWRLHKAREVPKAQLHSQLWV